VGDLKTFEEASIFLGTCLFLKGDLAKSVEVTTEARESARRRGNIIS
jgi:hypothetical protein